MNQQNHIIHKLELEINTPVEQTAYEIKDHIGDFLKSEVLPQIERLLDELITQKQRIRFEELDLNLQLNKWNDSDSLMSQIEKQIRRKLDGISDFSEANKNEINGTQNGKGKTENGVSYIEQTLNQEEIFFDFIKTGILPWHTNKQMVLHLFKVRNWNVLLEVPSFVSQLRQLLMQDRNILQRFINQVPLTNVLLLLAKTEIIFPDYLKEMTDDLECFSVEFRSQLILVYIHTWLFGLEQSKSQLEQLAGRYKKEKQNLQGNKNRSFEKWFRQYLNKKVLLKQLSNEESDKTLPNLMKERGQLVHDENIEFENNSTIISRPLVGNEREKESLNFVSVQNEWMVQNAGQVLFHPFIRLLFQNLGWSDAQGLLKDENKVSAVQALHYANTAEDTYFEPDLLLEKFLCRIPFHQTIPSAGLLNPQIKREITLMVKEVIKNWPELKNTSPVGLREAFIQRSGKLTKNENGYKLIVERKVQDVLLEKLNWNISIIKMPWQKELLFVEW